MPTPVSLLSVVLFLPLLGAFFILFIRSDDRVVAMNSRHAALFIAGCTFLFSAVIFVHSYKSDGFKYVTDYPWLPSLGISWHIGVDKLSLGFMLLVSFLMFVSILASKRAIVSLVREYLVLILVLETFLLITVCAKNLFLYAVFYEGSIILLFMLIAVFGIEKRAYSAFRFFIYAGIGIVLSISGILYLYAETGMSSVDALASAEISLKTQTALLLTFTAAFMFKAPLVPFHSWFVEAEMDSSAPVSILLGGVFTPLAVYGFLRIVYPVTPDVFETYSPYFLGIAFVSCVYSALNAFSQTDLKKIGAYAHIFLMSVIATGLFLKTRDGVSGALYLTLMQGLAFASYTLAAGALFLRLNIREIGSFSGLGPLMPRLAFVFLFSCLALAGIPPSPLFLGYFFAFKALFIRHAALFALACAAAILLIVSLARTYIKGMLGETSLNGKSEALFADLTLLEKILFAVLGLPLISLSLMPREVWSLVSLVVRALGLKEE